MKTIEINCTGSEYIPLSKFNELQGNLKELDQSSYEILERSLEKYGIIAPWLAWRDSKKKIWIMDATQRTRICNENVKSGKWTIKDIPTIFIKAKNRKEAKEKLLVLNGKAAKITYEGLYEFINKPNFELDIETFETELDLPDIDLESFKAGWMEDNIEKHDWQKEWKDMPEYNQEDKTGHSQIVVHFETLSDRNDFIELINAPLTDKSKYIWYPYRESDPPKNYRYE